MAGAEVGAQTVTLTLPVIQLSRAFPRARGWSRCALRPSPGASMGAGLSNPPPGAPPGPRPRALPCGGELPGASSSWRAGGRDSAAPERRDPGHERWSTGRCAFAPAGWGGHGRRRCRLAAAGVERGQDAVNALSVPAQRPRLGKGARLRPRNTRTDN